MNIPKHVFECLCGPEYFRFYDHEVGDSHGFLFTIFFKGIASFSLAKKALSMSFKAQFNHKNMGMFFTTELQSVVRTILMKTYIEHGLVKIRNIGSECKEKGGQHRDETDVAFYSLIEII